jgi:hypothetical protein
VLTILRSWAVSLVEWLKPFKELLALFIAISVVVSGAVAYGVSYFATREHVEALECLVNAKFDDLLPLDTSRDEAEIESRSKFAAHLTLLPPTIDTKAFSAQLQKDINELKDKRAEKFRSLVEVQRKIIRRCNPRVRMP